ncbi:MAG TPA: GGDEF domain-containing protein [Luteimonas sp.]
MYPVDLLFSYVIGGFGAWAAALMMLVAFQGDQLHRGALSRCALGFALLGAGMVLSGLTDRTARWPSLVLALAALVGTMVIYRALRRLVGARGTPVAWQLAEILVLCALLIGAWFAGPRDFAVVFHLLCLTVSMGITWTMRRALVAPRNAAEAAVAVTLLIYASSWVLSLAAVLRHVGPEHRHLLYVSATLMPAYAVLYALLPLLVGVLVLNLANARLHYRLREHANTDELTGLLTRRGLLERATAWQADVLGRGLEPAVLLLDVDHFKPINDTHGHERGDEVLRAVSGRLQRTLRAGTPLARWGGEEFLVLLEAATLDEAGAAADRMRTAVSGAPFAFPDAQLEVTASIGVAAWPRGGDFAQAVARADAALYTAKREGRDQARVSGAWQAVPSR